MAFAATRIDHDQESSSCYEYISVTGAEAVDLVMGGRWGMPGFQRAFVWRPQQVADLADSLWRGFPIGQLLIWKSSVVPATMWIADGQQRLTSLCLLFGTRPPWWEKREVDRRNLSRPFDLRVDIEAQPPLFHCSYEEEIEDPAERLIRASEILAHDATSDTGREALRTMAAQIGRRRGPICGIDEDHLYRVLRRVAMIRQLPLSATYVRGGLDQVLEIFERLNSRGSRFRRLLLNLAMRSLVSASRTKLSRSALKAARE